MNNINECFDFYKESIFIIDHDLKFWHNYIKPLTINDLNEDRVINSSIFCLYEYQSNAIKGTLRSHEKVYTTKKSDLKNKKEEFFSWITILSILKAYNSLEILILQLIQLVYFPNLSNPVQGKKQYDEIQKEIKNYLKAQAVKCDTKSNKHLIEFLKIKSQKFNDFLNLQMNVDLKTNWLDFFYIISVLRNIVAHTGMIVQKDIQNEIKGKGKDVFERFFEIKRNIQGLPILTPKIDIFTNFLSYFNSFTANMCKFVYDKNDLAFIGLK